MSEAVVRVFRVPLEPSDPAARAATRQLLAPLVGTDPASVPIVRTCERCGHETHGRPRIAGHERISFSVSHSADTALVAIATSGVTVGVDLEARRPRVRLRQLAGRVLTPADFDAWQQLDDDARLDEFLRVWTAKEAYLKAIGLGIVTRLADVPLEPEGWHITTIDAPAGFVAALATDEPVAVAYEVFSASGGTAS